MTTNINTSKEDAGHVSGFSRREQRGAYYTIFKELTIEDSGGFAEYMRMRVSQGFQGTREHGQFLLGNMGT